MKKGFFKNKITAAAAGVMALTMMISGTAFASGAKMIGLERAKELAFAKAGVQASSVYLTKAKLDFDDGRYEYEVEFYYGALEYEVSVDAYNGGILEFSAEYDD